MSRPTQVQDSEHTLDGDPPETLTVQQSTAAAEARVNEPQAARRVVAQHSKYATADEREDNSRNADQEGKQISLFLLMHG